ncbi:response regulator [Thermosynechococcus sp. HN-54]|uniref:response regulator n=1 Tax=Thermosynechococcus sp. HN-54 TaxID=2933959 RepID=UPI00202CB0D2|nr:response regulator [Thermosynechococcus sp. HN-54]URR35469.1 response regulator [Thermosynechococcus sp. HN-54]
MTQTPAGTTRPVIACIDDSHTVQRQVSLILQRSGYDVLTFVDATTAVPSLIAHPPHLILLDLNLPGMDGYEICRQLRRSPQLEGVPIVMLTAKDDPVHRIRARGVGAVDYITKPVTPQELLKRIQKLLNAGMPTPAAVTLQEGTLLWSIAHLRLILSPEQRQKLVQASEKLKQAIAKSPNNPKLYAKLALGLYLANQLAAAREVLQTLVSLAPAELNYRRNLAWLEEQLGNSKGAIAHYQYILQHDPQDQRSQARLAFLQGL